MLAYVDENGMLHDSPLDIKRSEAIDVSEIQVSVPKQVMEEFEPLTGKVDFFNDSKGFGFVKDTKSGERFFFHITNAYAGISEGDKVTYEKERGPRGTNAVRISMLTD